MCMSHYFIGFGSAHLQSALAPSDNECSHRPMCLVRMHHPTVRFSFTLELLLGTLASTRPPEVCSWAALAISVFFFFAKQLLLIHQ